MSAHGSTMPARRVTGPAAMSGDARRFLHLTTTLAVTDWKLRFYGSVLGYVWSLLRPLMLFAILLFVFSQIVRLGVEIEHYPLLLLVGVVLFSYFSEVTGDGVTSVLDHEQLVRKVTFPRMVVPLSVALAATFNLGLSLVVVVGFVLVSGIEPQLTWLLVPVPVLLLVLFSTGVAMLVSALYVPYRDVKPIWEVVTQALFYATPIFYPIEFVIDHSAGLGKAVMANPLAAIVVETRHLILGTDSISAAEAMGGAGWLVIPGAALVAVVAVGFFTFNRMAPRVAEQL